MNIEHVEATDRPSIPTEAQQGGLLWHQRWGWRDAVYLSLLTVLVVIMAIRYTPNLTSEVPGMWWDPLLNIWTMTWDTTTLLHAPTHLWQAPLFYPNTLTLSYSENLLGEALLFAPFFLLSHNPVFAYNMVFYLTFLLCGVSMYVLARYYTGKPFAAFIAALVYAFAPYRIGQIDHIHVVAGEWMPLAFLFLDLALRRNRWRYWSLFALFYLLQLLSSIYYGIFLIYTLLAYVIIRYGPTIIQQLRQSRVQRQAYLLALKKASLKPAIVFASTLAILAVLMTPYLLSLSSGLSRGIDQAETYSAFISDFRFTAPFNLLYGIAVYKGVSLSNDSEHYLFLGFTIIVLSGVGILLAMRRRDIPIRTYIWTALVVLLFAFGPALQFTTPTGGPLLSGHLPHPLPVPYPPAIPLPWFLAYFILPGFKGLRVPARLVGVLLMFLALFAAYAVAQLQEIRFKPASVKHTANAIVLPSSLRAAMLYVVLALLPLALLVEAVPSSLPVTHVPTGRQIPAVYQWLATHGGKAPIVELPMAYLDINFSSKSEAWYDYYTIYHPHPIANGWSGYRPESTTDLAYWLLDFPSPTSIVMLQRAHIRYVVVHRQLYDPQYYPLISTPDPAALRASPDIRLVAQFGDDSVWQMVGVAEGEGQ